VTCVRAVLARSKRICDAHGGENTPGGSSVGFHSVDRVKMAMSAGNASGVARGRANAGILE